MSFKLLPRRQVIVPENRQRKEFDEVYITDLAQSIDRNGLINLPVLRGNSKLVAGECRLRAIDVLWMTGGKLRYAGEEIPEGFIPYQDLTNLDPIDAYEIELEENIRRKDLTWQEQAEATSKLMALRSTQAVRKGEEVPSVTDIAKELRGSSGAAFEQTRAELLVSKHLSDPDVAKAKTAKDALKVLKRKEDIARSEALGKALGPTFTAESHTLLNRDALAWLTTADEGQFDCILTDPIYGIDAHEFNDSGGKAGGGGNGSHFYDDSYELWCDHISVLAVHGLRVTKPQAHLYAFCDVDRFTEMKQRFESVGWKVFRTPLVWVNPTAIRAPWPDQGPQRKYQLILYAVKGSKHVKALRPDVVTFPSDDNLNHHAQKPVALYSDLLQRSCGPGDSVLDCFCGSGPIFPSAHELKVKATGIELNPAAYGIAAQRLKDLK
jgi:DNA modification methylase